MKRLIADAGYKTPAIAKLLIDDGIQPVFPYKRPSTKEGFFRKHEYVYDEYYDCYICPNSQVLSYRTTNRDGYREYKSSSKICAVCPYLSLCTESKDQVKLVTRHIWESYMEICEDIRQTTGMKDLYSQRKQTIERLFGTAKENHVFRYTQMLGKARMEMKVGLTFACLNLKKLAKIIQIRDTRDMESLWFLCQKLKFLFLNLQSKCNRVFKQYEGKTSSSKEEGEFFHFHFASLLRFMAANLSFTQFDT